jgi:hypothetical protein
VFTAKQSKVTRDFELNWRNSRKKWNMGRRRTMNKKQIPETINVSAITDITWCENGFVLGSCTVLGVPFHCTFIRVRRTRSERLQCTGTRVAHEIFENLDPDQRERFQTVRIPGQSGEWVLVIQPFWR